MTGSGLSVFVMDKSADAFTDVAAVAELFAVFGSVVVLLNVAVLLIEVPLATLLFTLAMIVKVAVAPFASVPIVHAGADHEPTEGVALINVRPAGNTSFTATDCASLDPLLVTVIV